MFKWLKEKLAGVVKEKCRENLRQQTQTLRAVADRVYSNLQASGFVVNDYDITGSSK
jgi:hypothetical protein